MLKLEHMVSCKENSVMKAVVLEENSKELHDDTELRLYAESLGIDPDAEPELLWIAREGISASLPKGWQVLQDENNQIFYYNSQTGVSLWEHPLDQRFRQRVSLARRRCTVAGNEPSTAADGEHQNTLTRSVDNAKACNKLRLQHQLVCNSNRLPMDNDDWKSTPLLGDEVVPASKTTVVKAGACAGDGDLTDMTTTTTEYCTLVVPSSGKVSMRPSLLMSRDCQNGREEEATRQNQSNTTAVACQTQSEGNETRCPTRPTASAAARYLVDLDRADRTLARLRNSLRRDYLTLDESSLSSKGLSVLLAGGDLTDSSRRLVLQGDSKEQQLECSSAVKSTPAIAGQQLPAGLSFVQRGDFLSPVPARTANIRCPIVGTSPSEANESDGLGVARQQVGSALGRQTSSSSPGSSVHGTRGVRCQSLLASADRLKQPRLATLLPTGTLVNVCQHNRPSGGGGSAVLHSQQHTTMPRKCQDYNFQPENEEHSDGDGGDGLQEKGQRLRQQESFAVKDACGHLLEERSRLERKLMRLRLIYKTYKQRLANLDASIQLLHTNSQSAPATSRDSCYGNGTWWSREKRSSPPGRAYRQQVSVILADQVNETAAASHCRRLGVPEQDEDDADEEESRRRSSSVPRHSTGFPLAESMQSCSCCRFAQASSVLPDESLDHRLANLTLTADQSRPSGLPHRPIVGSGRCARRQVVVDHSPPAVVNRSGDNIHLLASVSPAPRDLGKFEKPRLDVSPTWQHSD